MRTTIAILAVGLLVGCNHRPGPAELDPHTARCLRCDKPVSDLHFAAQVVAPGEQPRFFDDVGCLRDWLRTEPRLPKGAVAYVADHRTGRWVRADLAVYTVAAVTTPARSHVVANADAASRKADEVARNGRSMAAAEMFAPALAPAGTR